MALIECPECQRRVSDKAVTCPHCGHPIVTYDDAYRLGLSPSEVEAGGRKGWAGSRTILMLIGIVVLIVVLSHAGERTEVHSTCNSDWHLCADNSDLVNHWSGISGAQVSCKYEGEKLAKYCSPKWPWLSFGTFFKGDAYLKNGVAILVENDAQFSNAFGAMVHSTVTCRYDLKQKKVLEASVAPN
jgi:hypothetical protein